MTRECKNLVEYRYLKDDSMFTTIKPKRNRRMARREEFKSQRVKVIIYADLEIWCQDMR